MDISGSLSKHIYFPMNLHSQWKDQRITKVKIVIKGSGMDLSGNFNFIRMNYDTRHSVNTTLLLSAARTYYEFTGDKEFLERNLSRYRSATEFLLTHLKGESGLVDLSYFTGHDGVRGLGRGIGNGYWDIMAMPPVDLYGNIFFYRAIDAMVYLEEMAEKEGIEQEKPSVTGSDNTGTVTYNQTVESLKTLRETIKKKIQTTFWDDQKGRFFEGYNVDGEKIDYGFICFNLEVIASGIATDAQAKKIMSWIDGDRKIAGDTSTGKDIYANVFAPRSTTLKNSTHYIWAWGGTNEFGEQVQDGGSIMYTSYHDIMSRLAVLGADNAFDRLKTIQGWYEDVKAAGGEGEQFYRAYYEKIGVQMQGGNTAGGIGLDFEFLESALLYASVPLGFFGISSNEYNVLKIAPNMTEQMDYFTIENLTWHGIKYDASVGKNFVDINCVRGETDGMSIDVTLEIPTMSSGTVYVNGEKAKSTVRTGNTVTVRIPFENCRVVIG